MARKSYYNKKPTTVTNKDTFWRVGGYLRLSKTKDKSQESDSILSQRLMVQDFVKSNSDFIFIKAYIDDGLTGLNTNRPSFEQMIDDIKNKKINCIIVKDLSRLGRGSKDIKILLEETLPQYKCRFISIGENIDTHLRPNEVFDIIVQYIQMLNEKYSFDISQSAKKSLRIQRLEGQCVSPQSTYGYLKDKENPHLLRIDEEPAEIVKLIFDLWCEGYSVVGIANYLNEHNIDTPSMYKKKIGVYKNCKNISKKWYPQTVRATLTNIVYIGHLEQYKMCNANFKSKKYERTNKEDRIIVKNTHEPIISQEQFEKAAYILTLCVRSAPSRNKHYLFAGFLKCADCGRAMIRSSKTVKGKEYTYYNCRTFNQIDKTACVSHSISEPKLKKIVFNAIKSQIYAVANLSKILDIVNTHDVMSDKIKFIKKKINQSSREIESIKEEKIDLYKDWKKSKVSDADYESFNISFNEEIKKRSKSIESFQEQLSFFESVKKKDIRWLKDFLQYFDESQLNRTMLLSLISEIKIERTKKVEIVFRYADEIDILMKMLVGKHDETVVIYDNENEREGNVQ